MRRADHDVTVNARTGLPSHAAARVRSAADGPHRRGAPPARRPRRRAVAVLGSVPQRTPVGDGPRGLQRRRRRLVVLLARPVPVAGLPLGRGRPRRAVRRAPAAVPRPGPVERARPDPQGAPVRPHQQRGQPRRGRQGVLLLPRQPAHPQLPALAVQVPARRLPVRRPGGDEPLPVPPRAGVRAARHRRVRRRPLRRRRGDLRQGRAARSRRSNRRDQPQRRGRPDPRPADAVVPQHVDVPAAHLAPDPDGRRAGRRAGRAPRARRLAPPHRGRRRPAVLRQRDQRRPAVGLGRLAAVPEGRHRRARPARRGDGEPRRHRHQGRRPLPARRAGRRVGRGVAPPGSGRRAAGRPVRRRRRGRRPPAGRGRRVLRRHHATGGDAPTPRP